MLHGLVLKCVYAVFYEASICKIYSGSNVFWHFLKDLRLWMFSLTEGKNDVKYCLVHSLILLKVFLHSTLHHSSRVVSPNVSSTSQCDK